MVRSGCANRHSKFALVLLLGVAHPAIASAQRAVPSTPVERNLPPQIASSGGVRIGYDELGASNDGRPLGVDVRGIDLIGLKQLVRTGGDAGISYGAIGDVSKSGLNKVLTPFLGRPLSRKLISDMQAAIARYYRAAGYPFVSITVPPQEVTGGIVTLRIIEFRAGGVQVKGGAGPQDAALAGHVRVNKGDRISAPALDEDISWLNRYPYRAITGIFAPSNADGFSDLTLDVTRAKPWRVFAGWSNTGTRATDLNRYFTGFGAALPPFGDSFISYQATGSWNFWTDPLSLNSGAHEPNYFSQATRVVIPMFDRQSIEIAPDQVVSRQDSNVPGFAYTNSALELPITYRFALSNLFPDVHFGDAMFGASVKQVSRNTYYEGETIGGASANLFETSAGWSLVRSGAFGTASVDVRGTWNPGGVVGGNDDQAWQTYSGGRISDISYAYGALDAALNFNLPAQFSWVSQFSGILSGQALPDVEQITLGGFYATRGYTVDDGNADTGFFWRNELHAPSIAPALGLTKVDSNALVEPFVFGDLGWGLTYGYNGLLGSVGRSDTHMASIGSGIDITAFGGFNASLVAGYALQNALNTQAGDWTVQARMSVTY